MATYSWFLPSPPSGPVPPGGSSSGQAQAAYDTLAFGLYDIAIDPATRDFIDAEDGGLVETTDSRTAVLYAIEVPLNRYWADYTQGSRVRAIMNSIDPSDVLMLVDEMKRCLQPLVDEHVIGNLQVSSDADEAGRPVVLLAYTDGTTGTPVDISFVPFNL